MPGVPNTFANASGSIPLSQLDANFNTTLTIGTTSVGLGNTISTISNVAISTGSVNGSPIGNVTASTGAFTTVTATSIQFGSGTVLNTYTESSYTGTVTGCSTGITKTIYYTKVGNLVVVDTQEIAATSNATTKTITGAPAAIQPSTANKRFITNVSDNGGTYVAGMVIFNGGTFSIYPNLSGGNWTASGTAVIEDFHISFTMA